MKFMSNNTKLWLLPWKFHLVSMYFVLKIYNKWKTFVSQLCHVKIAVVICNVVLVLFLGFQWDRGQIVCVHLFMSSNSDLFGPHKIGQICHMEFCELCWIDAVCEFCFSYAWKNYCGPCSHSHQSIHCIIFLVTKQNTNIMLFQI